MLRGRRRRAWTLFGPGGVVGVSANRRDPVHRRLATLVVLAALASAPAALAGGPSYVLAGGAGVRTPDGKTRFVAIPTRLQTAIARVRVADGSVTSWAELDG